MPLAGMQLLGARDDLSSGQSFAERTPKARAYQNRLLGHWGASPRSGCHLHADSSSSGGNPLARVLSVRRADCLGVEQFVWLVCARPVLEDSQVSGIFLSGPAEPGVRARSPRLCAPPTVSGAPQPL